MTIRFESSVPGFTTVRTSQGSYKVVTDYNTLKYIGKEMHEAGLEGRVFIISDRVLFPKVTRYTQEVLEDAGFKADLLVSQMGETKKTLELVRKLYEWLAERKAERGDVIAAMGGGTTGDVAGFVAATWLRGVPFVQIPSTLSAIVDASIGGKVGVNLPFGKNMVGAFYQPKLVIQDLNLMETLPKRVLTSGWAETLKHGLILDDGLLDVMEREHTKIISLTGDVALDVIRRSVAIKAAVISDDEFERGDARALLNYGHTIGHAIESVTKYTRFWHGEAVAIGMMASAHISTMLGISSSDLIERQQEIFQTYGLPLKADGLDVEEVLQATQHDKKKRGGVVRWVLLKKEGHAIVSDKVPEEVVRNALKEVLV